MRVRFSWAFRGLLMLNDINIVVVVLRQGAARRNV